MEPATDHFTRLRYDCYVDGSTNTAGEASELLTAISAGASHKNIFVNSANGMDFDVFSVHYRPSYFDYNVCSVII